MKSLNQIDIKKLEEYWIKHDENKKMLQFREWELTENPEQDDNLGASSTRVVTKPTEQLAILLLNDVLYQNLQTIVKSVERLYKWADPDVKTIVDMRYWDIDRNCFEWEEVADRLNLSRSKVLRLRNSLLDDTAELIGWV